MRFLSLTVLLLLTAAVASAAPTAEAISLSESPVIDGQLNEAVWLMPAAFRDFVVLGGQNPAETQTEAWVAHDADALYVAIKAHEPDMDALRAECKVRDSLDIFKDDVVEVYLDPAHDRFHFLQFACNALGTRFDLQGDAAGSSPEWNGFWEAATGRGVDYWTVEMRLPFATLGVNRGTGELWGMNVCRERPGAPENSSWAMTAGSFGTPQNFGDLRVPVDLTPFYMALAVTDWGQGLHGQNKIKVGVQNLGDTGRKVNLRLQVTSPDEQPRMLSVEGLTLAAGETLQTSVDYQLFQAGAHELLLMAVDPTGRLLVAEGRKTEAAGLAEFTVFKSFYQDNVTLQYRLNVPEDALAEYRLAVQVTPVEETQAVIVHEPVLVTERSGMINLDTKELARGRYLLQATLTDVAGKELLSKKLQFAEWRDLSVESRLVTVRPGDNMLLVQGKPFFPLGIYESPGSEAYLQILREAGFNLCLSNSLPAVGTQILLDKVYAAGMRLWVPVGEFLDFSTDVMVKRQRLNESVARVGDHPGLLMWESIDEPAWAGANADALYEGYCHLRQIDQQRLIWTNHAPRNLLSTLAYYNRATDAAGCDIYPVPNGAGHSNLPNASISVVGDETNKNRQAVNNDKPIFMVLQGFGWGELSKGQTPPPAVVMPSFEQSRFMAYDAIIHGANGLLYWGTHYTEKPSRFWSELRSLVSELATLQDVLAAPRTPVQAGVPQTAVIAPEQGVALLHKQYNKRNFIFLANETDTAVTASVYAPGIFAGRLRRLFEGQTVAMGPEQILTIDLQPYGVAVLTDDADLADVRRDFSADWRDAPDAATLRAQMVEEGNILQNPGFEADRDGDNLPDRWGSITPLTASLTTSEIHGGKLALALTSSDVAMGPLMVQRGLEVKPDHKYRFTAWVKSPSPEVEFRIYVEWTAGGKWLGGTHPWTKGTGEWQQLNLEFTTTPDPQGGAYTVVQMRGQGTVYFDDLRIEEITD